jgi:hypothetical protein
MLLIKFRWPDVDRVASLANMIKRDIELFEAIESDLGYGCVDAPADAAGIATLRNTLNDALPGARAVVLQTIAELPGASADSGALYRYVVETDVLPEHEAYFNRWYAQEHLSGLAGVPGTVGARRLCDPVGSPRYYAWYDLAAREALDSPPWLAVRATPWSDRVRPAFRNTQRTMFSSRGSAAGG